MRSAFVRSPGGPQVFAAEDRSLQLSWRRLPTGPVTVRSEAGEVRTESDGGPAVLDVHGLEPGRVHRLTVATSAGTTGLTAATVATPPGDELYRFATVNDVHLGATNFGVFHTMTERGVDTHHPVRCARSALADLTAWGAARLVVKGDLVDQNLPSNWSLAADLLGSTHLPWDVVPGNHELAHGDRGAREMALRHGVDLVESVRHVDVPGLRIVMMNSAVDGRDIGRWHHLEEEALDAVAEAGGPAMLLVHHHPQPARVPTHHPPGIDAITARRFLRNLRRANPQLIGASGHTHRNRHRDDPGVPWSEVGSTKDYPGVWAGYVVHEGGIRQVSRRVSAPDCLPWLDLTRRAAGGVWGRYSPGTLADRCFTYAWPRATAPGRPAPGGR